MNSTPNKQQDRKDSLAIIPARMGSKGIPGKNKRPFLGKPLITYSIEAALECIQPNHVVVSSDDPEILEIANSLGVIAQKRPDELAQDATSTEPVLEYVLDKYKQENGSLPTYTVLLQPTSPFRRPGRVGQALDLMTAKGYDSLVSAAPYHGFVWQDKAGTVSADYDPRMRPRRQDLEVAKFLENGSLYVFKSERFLSEKSRLFGDIGIFPMSAMESFEIDEPEDWEILEAIAKSRLERTA